MTDAMRAAARIVPALVMLALVVALIVAAAWPDTPPPRPGSVDFIDNVVMDEGPPADECSATSLCFDCDTGDVTRTSGRASCDPPTTRATTTTIAFPWPILTTTTTTVPPPTLRIVPDAPKGP